MAFELLRKLKQALERQRLNCELGFSSVCSAWVISKKLSILLLPTSLSLPDILSVLPVSVSTPTYAFLHTCTFLPSPLLFFSSLFPRFVPYKPLSPVLRSGKLFLPKFLLCYLGKGGSDCRFRIIHVIGAQPSKLGNSWAVEKLQED